MGGPSPYRGRTGVSHSPRSHDSEKPFSSRNAGPGLLPLPGSLRVLSTACVPFSALRRRGARAPFSLHRPAEGRLKLEWGGADMPEAFASPASYPEACSAARARPASPASAAAAPTPPSLPEPAEPREPGGAPAAAASSSLWSPRTSSSGPGPAMRARPSPAFAPRARGRALQRTALPAWDLPPSVSLCRPLPRP